MIILRGAVLVLAVVLVSGCVATNYTWGWYTVWPGTEQGWINLKFMLGGLLMTVELSVVAIALSVVIGLVPPI